MPISFQPYAQLKDHIWYRPVIIEKKLNSFDELKEIVVPFFLESLGYCWDENFTDRAGDDYIKARRKVAALITQEGRAVYDGNLVLMSIKRDLAMKRYEIEMAELVRMHVGDKNTTHDYRYDLFLTF